MKKLLLFTTAIILLSFSFSSCKKKDKEETATEKIQHNWSLVSIVTNSHDGSGDDITNIPVSQDDYINFTSNGTVTSFVGGINDTSSYSIISDSQIIIDSEPFTIKTLTSSQLVLYSKDEISATEYDETTISLER